MGPALASLAGAILDRLIRDAEVLTIDGPSFRLKGRLDALRQPLDRSPAPLSGPVD